MPGVSRTAQITTMVWSYEEITRDWLDGAGLPIEPAEVVRAFEVVERMLGNEWIRSRRVQPHATVWGVGPTLGVVFLGQRLSAIEGCVGAAELVERIREDDRASVSELTAMYLAKAPGAEVEIGPEVQVDGGRRRPDFRLRMPNETWVYVEVAAPDTSVLAERVQAILERIGNILPTLAVGSTVEVFLRTEPTDVEIDTIVTATANAIHDPTARIAELPALALLAINQDQPGQVIVRDYGESPRPRRGFARAEVVDGRTTKHVSVRIPFTDERAEAFLTNEARQLPTTEPGLIMIDMSATPTGFRAWEPLISRRFQPTQHTRVGAACLFHTGLMLRAEGEEVVPETLYLNNPHARLPIPEWLRTRLCSFVGRFSTNAG